MTLVLIEPPLAFGMVFKEAANALTYPALVI
jgi:hypothetical protein